MTIDEIKTMIEGAPNYLSGSMRQEGGRLYYTIREMSDFHCKAWIMENGNICEACGGDSNVMTPDELRRFLYEGI